MGVDSVLLSAIIYIRPIRHNRTSHQVVFHIRAHYDALKLFQVSALINQGQMRKLLVKFTGHLNKRVGARKNYSRCLLILQNSKKPRGISSKRNKTVKKFSRMPVLLPEIQQSHQLSKGCWRTRQSEKKEKGSWRKSLEKKKMISFKCSKPTWWVETKDLQLSFPIHCLTQNRGISQSLSVNSKSFGRTKSSRSRIECKSSFNSTFIRHRNNNRTSIQSDSLWQLRTTACYPLKRRLRGASCMNVCTLSTLSDKID